MPALKSSGSSRRSKSAPAWGGVVICAAVLSLISAAAIFFVQQEGTALFYGDAAAHLNIARRLFDGRNPGYEQIGTVWLPLPHLLMMPFAKVDAWWQSGLAGAIPAGIAWVFAGTFLFATLRRTFGHEAAIAGTAVFATQPNLLYLQSTPMTESIFFACALGMLLFSVRLAETESPLDAALAGLCGCAASLTRYEGWILIPIVGLYILFAGGSRRWACAFTYGLVAAIGPLYWLAHNQIMYSDWLEFYRGIGSAKDIQKRIPYPGAHDWIAASRQFAYAVKAVCGLPLIILAALGIFPALLRRAWWPVAFCLASPLFYIWSLQSGDTPIYIPEIFPFSHYNSRYALAALPLFIICSAALASYLPRFRWAIPVIALTWFVFQPITVKREGEVNSESRREWTRQVATLLKDQYQPGTGILMPFGDLTGILQQAGIPIREAIHQGDKLEFDRATARPDLFLDSAWVIAQSADKASGAMARARAMSLHYRCVKLISLKHAPVIEVWRRYGP
jgi:hypothetical protein